MSVFECECVFVYLQLNACDAAWCARTGFVHACVYVRAHEVCPSLCIHVKEEEGHYFSPAPGPALACVCLWA